jgi:hypothetical protein
MADRLPYLHRNSRSSRLSSEDILEVFNEKPVSVLNDVVYENPQSGAAWHAVSVSKKRR